MKGDLRIDARDGALAAKVIGRTGDSTELHTDGTLRLERLARWTGRANTDGRLESNFVLNAAADSAGLVSLDGTVNAIGGIGGVRLNTVHLALQPDPGAIRVDTLLIRSNVGELNGGGRIALRSNAGVDTLRLTGFTRNLEPLAALAGLDSVSLDSSRVALRITGPAWHWRLDADGEARGLLSGGNLAARLKVQGGATVDSTQFTGVHGDLQVENAAYGTLRIPEARVAARYDSLIALDANVALGDSVRIATALRGSTAGDTTHVTLQRLDLTEGGRSWALEQPAALTFGPQVVIDQLGLRSGTRSITLDGTFDRRGTSDMTLRLANVDLDALQSVKLSPIGGRLDGWLRFAGTSTGPSLAGSLGLTVHQREGSADVGRIRTDLAWTHENLRVDATAAPARGGRLTVNGTLPWQLTLTPDDTSATIGARPRNSGNVDLAVKADSFDLGLFQALLPPETARELRGRLIADARVTGTAQAPQSRRDAPGHRRRCDRTRAGPELSRRRADWPAGR